MASSSDNDDGIISSNWSRVVAVVQMFDVRRYPTDLAMVSLAVLTGILGIEMLPSGSTLRVLLALPMAFLWPGYALVQCLFPRSLPGRFDRDEVEDAFARLALAFGLSLAVLPLLLIVVGAFLPLTLNAILGTLGVFTLFVAQVAVSRRSQSRDHRSRRSLSRPSFTLSLFTRSTNQDRRRRLLTIGLTVAMLAAVGTVTVAVAHPPSQNDHSEFYLATQGDDGELTAGNYPSTVSAGDAVPLVTGVENGESTVQRYVVVIQLQRVDADGRVTERQELNQYSKTVNPGETWEHEHEVALESTGEDLRLTYLLYRDDVPDRQTRTNAEESLHLWVTVEDS